MDKKILITGAGGYIGRHVTTALLDRGFVVLACDTDTSGIDGRAVLLDADIFNREEELFVRLGAPDVCIHLAWREGFVHHADAHMRYLSDHFHFLCTMLNAGLKQLVVMGSMHEVGYFEGAVDENTPCNPRSLYGIAKDTLRKSILLVTRGKDVAVQWLRAFYVYGDDLRNQSVFTKLIRAEQEGKKTFPFNTGKNRFDFIHVTALAEQIAAVAAQTEVNGIINCCTGTPLSLGEKVEAFIKENNLSIRLEYGAFADRPYDSPGIWGNCEKIKKIMQGCGPF
jgi:dTDP-6-deoxy-L-talose 4-dehydrogenase (NAD+)